MQLYIIFTFFFGFACDNTTNRECTVYSNYFDLRWGVSAVCIINVMIFNRTIGQKYMNIHVSNKE